MDALEPEYLPILCQTLRSWAALCMKLHLLFLLHGALFLLETSFFCLHAGMRVAEVAADGSGGGVFEHMKVRVEERGLQHHGRHQPGIEVFIPTTIIKRIVPH
eukprot:1162083-Pelagomonas_calceolata.AAC.10